MKRILLFASLALATLVQANPAESNNEVAAQAVLQAVKEVQTQQVAMAENQAKIEERLAAIIEAIRVARIYSSRSGN